MVLEEKSGDLPRALKAKLPQSFLSSQCFRTQQPLNLKVERNEAILNWQLVKSGGTSLMQEACAKRPRAM